jgi:hypothetical protein
MSTKAATLRSLAENKTDGVSKTTTFRVDPKLIKFEKGFNLRTDTPELEEHIELLYLAYKAGDLVPAIDCAVDEDGNIVARDGHCRTKAAIRVRKEMPDFTVECRQFLGNDADAVIHMLNSGTGSKRLTPLEEGIGYLRLVKMGLKPGEIAEKRHVSRVTIENGITLAEAPAEVQQMIIAGEVSATTARKAIEQGKEAVLALKEAVKAERANPTPPKKDGKKKKVTAKKLKGTAAEKKPKKKKATIAADAPDEITVTVKREDADTLIKLVRDHAPDDEALMSFATSLETALL